MPIILASHGPHSLEDYSNILSKALAVQYWEKISGTGELTYSSTAMTDGEGRFEFSGTGLWELRVEVPINQYRGICCQLNHLQASGAGNVNIGVECLDVNKLSLGTRDFYSGATPVSIANVQSYMYLDGGTSNNFISGTRYLKIRISINSNTGVYAIDRPYYNYMETSQRALYI